jgi:RimJ/RimL family protein N-acetyltransferase
MTMPDRQHPPDQPIGPPVDDKPARRPEAAKLEGQFCRVEKLDPARHGDALWQSVKGHDHIWTYAWHGPFADGEKFAGWLGERAALADPYSYAVVDKAANAAQGIATLMEIRPAMRVIEVGNILYSPILQRTRAATEAQYLLARYVFEELSYRRYEWKCNAFNAPSMRAARRFGFGFEGIFRQHMIIKGRNRDTAWFAMLDSDWPAVRQAFERWLAPENFDEQGRQRESLSALNAVDAEISRG